MRLIAFEVNPDPTSARLRVAYRWPADPFAAPRLLYDGPLIPWRELRAWLEREPFGEPLRSADFTLVSADPDFRADFQSAFVGFRLVVLPGATLEEMIYSALPLPFREVCTALRARFGPAGADLLTTDALDALTRIESAPITLIGYARRAVYAVRAGLHTEHPDLSIQESNPDTVEIVDHIENAGGVALVCLAADPGLSAREAAILKRPCTAAIMVDVLPMSSDTVIGVLRDLYVQTLRTWLDSAFEFHTLEPATQLQIRNIKYVIDKITI